MINIKMIQLRKKKQAKKIGHKGRNPDLFFPKTYDT